jgi:hypothetical protein
MSFGLTPAPFDQALGGIAATGRNRPSHASLASAAELYPVQGKPFIDGTGPY